MASLAAAARPRSLGRSAFVLSPALIVGTVLAAALGLLGSSDRPVASAEAKEELRSEPPERAAASSAAIQPEGGPARPSSGPRPDVPVRLAVPAANIHAAVDHVGASPPEGIEIPSAGRTGWYRAGPRPGEPGRALIVGHVDTKRGPAVFAGLRSLERGDAIEVRDRSGRLHRYHMVTKEQVEKTGFPTDDVYGPTARRVLVLVTCGGPFEIGRGYRDNLIVYARAD